MQRVIAQNVKPSVCQQVEIIPSIDDPRNALPKDPHAPAFWAEVRRLQGFEVTTPVVITLNAICDLYLAWPPLRKLSRGTQLQYEHSIKTVRLAWGDLPAEGVQPKHVQALIDELVDLPGKANNILSFLWAFNKWGRARGHFTHSIVEGVSRYVTGGGHKPWTLDQQRAAEAGLTGALRRAYFLARYTGQRGSDVIRLGETFVDEGGFRILQKKTGGKIGDIWCPIEEPLAAEMATWTRVPSPYVRQEDGKVTTRPCSRSTSGTRAPTARDLLASPSMACGPPG